jgi:Arc/MetJ-type ribon-helix-helix transcriptional regulator
MANKLVNLRLDAKLLGEVDAVAKEGLYSNRTDFIKSALRKAIDDFRTRQALAELKRNFGRGKREGIREPTPEEFERIREEVGNEMLRRRGLL